MEKPEIEKYRLIKYVIDDIFNKNFYITFQQAEELVFSSILIERINSSPDFIAHCSMDQLVELAQKGNNFQEGYLDDN